MVWYNLSDGLEHHTHVCLIAAGGAPAPTPEAPTESPGPDPTTLGPDLDKDGNLDSWEYVGCFENPPTDMVDFDAVASNDHLTPMVRNIVVSRSVTRSLLGGGGGVGAKRAPSVPTLRDEDLRRSLAPHVLQKSGVALGFTHSVSPFVVSERPPPLRPFVPSFVTRFAVRPRVV